MCEREKERDVQVPRDREREKGGREGGREGGRGADRECEKIKLKMIKITSKERKKEVKR